MRPRRDLGGWGTNHDITPPPFKGAASQCMTLAKGEELVGGCGGIRRRVAWSPVHCGQGAICLLQHHVCLPAVYPTYPTPAYSCAHTFCLVTFPIHLSLVFFRTYIRLVNHVCFCSLYIDIYYQSPTQVQLKSHTSRDFQPPETIQLLILCLWLWASPETISTVPFNSVTSPWSIGSACYIP